MSVGMYEKAVGLFAGLAGSLAVMAFPFALAAAAFEVELSENTFRWIVLAMLAGVILLQTSAMFMQVENSSED